MDTKRCSKCNQIKAVSDFYFNQARSDGLSQWCRDCQRQAGTESSRRIRAELLAALGGVCNRCGFSDPRALQVDHVNGGGTVERKMGVWMTTRSAVQRVLDNPDQYQLLCANCNLIKRIEEREFRRDYERNVPTKRKATPGRGSSNGSKAALARARTSEHQSRAGKAAWGRLTPKQRKARIDQQRATATGRKLITGPDGKRHWVRPPEK